MGIVPGYMDTSGTWRETTQETREALLRGMGLDPAGLRWDAGPDVRVLGPEETLSVSSPSELLLEDGSSLPIEQVVPADLPVGYHWLKSQDGGQKLWIIKSPGQCWLEPGMRLWGWAIQLYAARSRQSWGVGDLGDLHRLAGWAAQLDADVLLINPLSAAAPVLPQEPSPYYPSSRRFRNPLYLCIERMPGSRALGAELEQLAKAGRALNRSRQIDRGAVFRLKMPALERLWERHPRDPAFEGYCREMGDGLQAFASYCVLAEEFGRNWQVWPAEYRRPESPAVERFARSHESRRQFHMWLQWQLDQQLADAAALVPLIQDLPVGVDPGGADAWQWQDVLAHHVTVGAPPDEFNREGQDWELPPFVPHRLRAAFFRPFIETIRSALRHAGGLRIDHVMGLFRLFWIPEGFGPKRGAYVRYPTDELLAIVAVESHRARAWVAGEDLGTVEHTVHQRLAEQAMLSYKLLWFEGRPPREYPELAMAAISTHDLPTIAGLWTGADFAAEQRIGNNPSEASHRALRERLTNTSGVPADASPEQAIQKAYEALGQAPSAVLVASLDDALAVQDRPNMPGTIDQWPNWRLALPKPIEELDSAPLPKAIAQSLCRGRSRSEPSEP